MSTKTTRTPLPENGTELATPSLVALELAMNRQKLTLEPEEFAKMAALVDAPPKAGARLKAAAKRCRR